MYNLFIFREFRFIVKIGKSIFFKKFSKGFSVKIVEIFISVFKGYSVLISFELDFRKLNIVIFLSSFSFVV